MTAIFASAPPSEFAPSIPRPTGCGSWWHRSAPEHPWRKVHVTETVSGGRICRELKMGGSSQTPFQEWSGHWFPSVVPYSWENPQDALPSARYRRVGIDNLGRPVTAKS